MKSPVLENCTPGSVRGALGNQRPYLANIFVLAYDRINGINGIRIKRKIKIKI